MKASMTKRDFLVNTMAVGAATTHALAPSSAAGARLGAGKPRNSKGVRTGMLPVSLPLLETFKMARDCGFDQIEPPATFDQEEAARIKEAAVAAYIDDFKSRWIKAYFDVGNVMPMGYPQDWIHTLGNRIVKVHLKDFDPKTRHFVNLGDGAVDWPAVRQTFADVGYAGTYTVELPPGDQPYLCDISQRIDRLLLSET